MFQKYIFISIYIIFLRIVKNKKAIVLIFISNIISGFAQGISMIAIPLFFISTLDEPLVFYNFYLFVTFLVLFWGLYAGTIIDRYCRKKIFVYTNIICGSIILFSSIYGFYIDFTEHNLDFSFFNIDVYMQSPLVLLVFGLTMFNYNIHYPNLYAFVQEITDKKNYGRINSYIEIQGQVTSMFAGAFAAILLSGINLEFGFFPELSMYSSPDFCVYLFDFLSSLPPLIVESWSIHEIFLMDAITYFISAILFLFIQYYPIKERMIDISSVYYRLKGGLNYLKNHDIVFSFGVWSYMLFAFTLVEIHVLLPLYVKRFLGYSDGSGFGFVFAFAEVFYSIGAILSGLLIYRFLRSTNTYLSIILLISVVSIGFFGMSFIDSLVLFFFVNLLLGITNAGVRILRTTYLFTQIPNNFMGRATSVFSSINVVVRMLLIYLFSQAFFLDGDNIRWGYFIGFIMLLITVLFLFRIYVIDKKSIT